MKENKNGIAVTENSLQKNWLSSQETAAFLDISMAKLYKLSSSGKLVTYSPTGGKIYFLKAELEEWLQSGKRATIKSINQKSTQIFNKKNL